MKVYIVIEGSYDPIIRCITLSHDLAKKIHNSFKHLGLSIEEHETIDDETLTKFLEVKIDTPTE